MKWILFVIFAIICFSLNGQNSRFHHIPYNGNTIEAQFMLGRIVKNHPDLPKNNGFTTIQSLNYYGSRSKRSWQKLYGYPSFGVSFGSAQFGNNDTYGNAYFTMLQMKFGERFSCRYRLRPHILFGTGLAYNTKRYNFLSNPENIAISSKINNVSKAELGAKINFNRASFMGIYAGIYHFSNGKASVPNVGINVPYVGISLAYMFQNSTYKRIKSDTILYKDRIRVNGRLGLGFTKSKLPTGPVLYVYTYQLFASKRLSAKNNVQAGFEIFKHSPTAALLQHQELSDDDMDATRFIFFAGHEFYFGHFSFLTQGGIYLDQSTNRPSIFSSRLGFNYYLKSLHHNIGVNPYVGLAVKSDFGEADFVELSIGCGF